MDPGNKVDLQRRVASLVHLVELVSKLEDEFVVLNLESLVGTRVGQTGGESHGPDKCGRSDMVGESERSCCTYPISWYW